MKRFWSKVDKSGECWEWKAGTFKAGYGAFHVQDRFGKWPVKYSHRIAWELTNGPIPKKMCVLHVCDNKLCVRPDHLFLGTIADNMRDKCEKGRQLQGSQYSHAKLIEEDIPRIRDMLKANVVQREIANVFGVSTSLISLIHSGKAWTHA